MDRASRRRREILAHALCPLAADAASAACAPAVQRLLDLQVDPNNKDEEGNTILSSISELFFDCDFEQIDWNQALAEEKHTLELLRSHGAKTSKELN